jgi:hypothetical protein
MIREQKVTHMINIGRIRNSLNGTGVRGDLANNLKVLLKKGSKLVTH